MNTTNVNILHVVGNMIEHVPHPCKNSLDGCLEKQLLPQITSHWRRHIKDYGKANSPTPAGSPPFSPACAYTILRSSIFLAKTKRLVTSILETLFRANLPKSVRFVASLSQNRKCVYRTCSLQTPGHLRLQNMWLTLTKPAVLSTHQYPPGPAR